MRMRRKKNREGRFEKCASLTVAEPTALKGKWKERFGNDNKIYLEIGCGKGDFVVESAKRNPNVNFIAVEKCMDVIILAMEKVMREELTNVVFMNVDAKDLCDIFEENEIDKIYLNFSDPWKKSKQAKRRLTYRTFLEIYKNILKNDGQLEFKTDNKPLFEFSLGEFAHFGTYLSQLTFDLHNSKYNENNIQTEYERNFSAQGFKINRVVVNFR